MRGARLFDVAAFSAARATIFWLSALNWQKCSSQSRRVRLTFTSTVATAITPHIFNRKRYCLLKSADSGRNLHSPLWTGGAGGYMIDRVQPIRVLAVIPGIGPTQLPAFMDRQLRSLARMNVDVRTFYLESRTSPRQILRCWQRFRRTCAEYRPHLVHAHYGTVTALFCGLATALPVVVTLRGSDLNPEPDSGFIRPYSGILLSQLAVL
jgi:hypothetical protein